MEEILDELANKILEKEGEHIQYTDDSLLNTLIISQEVLLSKIWDLAESESMDFEDRLNMAESFSREMRELIKKYTGIDTINLVK